MNLIKTSPSFSTQGTSGPAGGGLKQFFFSSSKLVMMFGGNAWHPATDVYETPKEIIVKTELAGINPAEVSITFEKDTLHINGKRYDQGDRAKRTYKRMEINYGIFEQTIILEGSINTLGIKASYSDGFLEIVIPKLDAKSKKSQPTKAVIEITLDK